MTGLLSTIAAALWPAAPIAQTYDEVYVGERCNGDTVRLHRGQCLVVSVSACIACAYSWSVRRRPRVLAAPEVRDGGGAFDGAVGGSKSVEYRFRTICRGRGVLELRYATPAGDISDDAIIRLTIFAD